MSKEKRRQLPKLETEERERKFWSEHDSVDFVDWASAGRRIFSNLRPTLRTISLRLPESTIRRLPSG